MLLHREQTFRSLENVEKSPPPEQAGFVVTPLLKTQEICEIFKCCRRSVEKMAALGQIPRGFLIGKKRFWRAEDIYDFISEKAMSTN